MSNSMHNYEKEYIAFQCVCDRAVLFRLFPKTVNLPPKPVGFRLTFIQ